ncbi:MAG: DUF951 domain-containing protein [Clostridia bacterium]|nr:DUF951 domain-containing protein [Clostridia bacterium]
MKYNVGDVIKSKKTHPCGSNEWTIIRVGADIKIKCNNCGRVLMFSLSDFDSKIIKK